MMPTWEEPDAQGWDEALDRPQDEGDEGDDEALDEPDDGPDPQADEDRLAEYERELDERASQ